MIAEQPADTRPAWVTLTIALVEAEAALDHHVEQDGCIEPCPVCIDLTKMVAARTDALNEAVPMRKKRAATPPAASEVTP